MDNSGRGILIVGTALAVQSLPSKTKISTTMSMTEMVLCALQQRKQVLTELVVRAMTDETLALLDGMFLRDDSAALPCCMEALRGVS